MSDDSDLPEGWEDPDVYVDDKDELVWLQYVSGLLGVVLLCLFIATTMGFCREKNPIAQTRVLKSLATGSGLLSSLVSWFFIIGWDFAFNDEYETALHWGMVSIVLYSINLIMILCIFGIRLDQTFVNTSYAIASILRVWLGCVVVIFVIIIIVVLYGMVAKNAYAVSYGATFALLFDTVNGIILLILFIKKLKQVIAGFLQEFGTVTNDTLSALNRQLSAQVYNNNQVTTDMTPDFHTDPQHKNSGKKKSDETKENMFRMNRIISDMTRFTILIGFAMFSTSFVGFISFIFQVTNTPRIYGTLFLILDSMVNYICLILQFKMARKWYKSCCGCLIVRCQQRQIKSMNKDIQKMGLMKDVQLRKLPTGDVGFDVMDHGEDPQTPQAGGQVPTDETDPNDPAGDVGDDEVNMDEYNASHAARTLASVDRQLSVD